MIQRVNGSLAVSRALGDFEYKNVDGKGPTEQLVSPEPEFYMKKRESDKDEFLVLACDGVWDVMTNEDICSFVAARMRVTDNLEQIANEVIDTCLHKVSQTQHVKKFVNKISKIINGTYAGLMGMIQKFQIYFA